MENKSNKVRKRGRKVKPESNYIGKTYDELFDTLNKTLPYYPLSPEASHIDENNPPEILELELLIYRIQCYISEKERHQKEVLIHKKNEKEQHDTLLKVLHFHRGYMTTKLALVEKENKRLLNKTAQKKIKAEEASSLPLPSFYHTIKVEETNDDYNYSSFHSPPPPSQTEFDTTLISSQRTLINDHPMDSNHTIKQEDSNTTIRSEPLDPTNNTNTKLYNDPLKKVQSFKFTFSPLRYGRSKKHNSSSSSTS
ncbi:unnamed protein product [Cunninghamella blakesleeana]